MATITKAPKVTDADLSGEVIKEAEVATTTANESVEVTKEDIARTITLLRYNLNEVFRDANRKRPLFSKTKVEAEARYRAAVISLTEFAESMTRL